MANRKKVGSGLIRRTKGGAEGSGGTGPTPPPAGALRTEDTTPLLTEAGQFITTETP